MFNKRQQIGQAMIEYTIVVGLGVMALTAAMSSGGTENTSLYPDTYSAKEALMQRIRDHYTGYSYAVSLSDYPDADIVDLNGLYTGQGLPQEMIDYLDDTPDSMVSAINLVQNQSFPNLQDAIDMVLDSNLSPTQILSP